MNRPTDISAADFVALSEAADMVQRPGETRDAAIARMIQDVRLSRERGARIRAERALGNVLASRAKRPAQAVVDPDPHGLDAQMGITKSTGLSALSKDGSVLVLGVPARRL